MQRQHDRAVATIDRRRAVAHLSRPAASSPTARARAAARRRSRTARGCRSTTTALPSLCTCIISLRAFAFGVAEELLEHVRDVVHQLIGSFQTITTHGTSRRGIARRRATPRRCRERRSPRSDLGAMLGAMRRRAHALGAHFRGDAREQPVDEAAGVLGGVLLRELDGFGDHDRGRARRDASRARRCRCAATRGRRPACARATSARRTSR